MRPALLALFACLAACATSPQTIRQTALDRAVFDLGCPAGSLAATQLGATTAVCRSQYAYGAERTVVGVAGCNQKAVYVVECSRPDVCNALLNSDSKPTAPAAHAP